VFRRSGSFWKRSGSRKTDKDADLVRTLFLLLTVLTLSTPGLPAGDSADSIGRLEWLAGCWEQRGPDRLTQEHWMAPLGKSMIGMSRTVTSDATVAWELLRIEESDGTLILIAAPSGQREARFAQIELTESGVAFENPEHDFPQRIEYRHGRDGSLVGRISGVVDGKARSVDFPMTRVRCPGPGGALLD
jgi:hypothetical protein